MFQHTATRRWLQMSSTFMRWVASFNTQPPEGGCKFRLTKLKLDYLFQHTATRRWLPLFFDDFDVFFKFQHTATRRWLQSKTNSFSW